MDLKKTDKDGKPLNLTPKANRSQSDYYGYWKNNPQSLEPTEEDIKCELQLQALGDFEQLEIYYDHNLSTNKSNNKNLFRILDEKV